MRKKIPLLTVLAALLTLPLWSQYDPRIHWQYVETEYNRIIFPDYMAAEGLRAAALTDRIHPLITETMTPLHIHSYPVILTGYDMISNGYVTLFPRRSVWYGFPRGYGAGTTDWYEHLAVHEGRHTVQFDTLNSSTAHILFLLGGESWYSLAVAMTPSWIYEGDAIVTETAYTSQGRGRLGSFSELMGSLALEERDYSYYKMRLGSFRDMTPTPHAFGYPFMDWLEREYGPGAAESLLLAQARWPLPLLGTTIGMRALTGLPPREAYRAMMDDLKEEREDLIREKGPLREGERLTGEEMGYTAYTQLSVGSSGEWYALRADFETPAALYRFAGSEEERLFAPVPSTRIDEEGGLFVWDSVRTDLAVPTREESDLYLRTESGSVRRLTRGGRYYHPALSSGGTIAALEFTRERIPRLVFLDREGEILREIDFPAPITYASWPVWEGDSLILLVQNRGGEALWRFDGEEFTAVTPFSTDDLSHPEPWRGGVFFSLDRETGREICYEREGRIVQVTKGFPGSDWPAVDRAGGRLLFIRGEGYRGQSLRALPLDGSLLQEEITLAPLPAGVDLPDGDYEVKDYNPLEFFSPVGWGITSGGMPEDDLEIPFTLVSVNPMQTLSWETGVYYNLNEETLDYRFRNTLDLGRPALSSLFSLDEQTFTASLGLELPFGFDRGRDSVSLTLYGEGFYLRNWSDSGEGDRPGFYGQASVTHSRSGSYRALQPRFEESLEASLLRSLDSEPLTRYGISGHLLLPGLFPSQGIGAYAYYENNPDLLTSRVPGVRGRIYQAVPEQIMARGEYVLPLFYPDAALGGLAYLPRVSMELFADRQWSGEGWETIATSVGGELLGDIYFLSLPVLFRGGLRYSWQWETNEPVVQVVLKGYSVGY